MNKQFSEMEKLEKLNNMDKKLNKINIDLNNKKGYISHNVNSVYNDNGKYMIHDSIKLNYKFDIIKIKKPIEFRTPSGKVIKLAEQKKAIEKRKDKEIKGKKLGKNKQNNLKKKSYFFILNYNKSIYISLFKLTNKFMYNIFIIYFIVIKLLINK